MPKRQEYESFGKQFLRIWAHDFEATWLLIAIPLISTVIALTIWLIKSIWNKRKKRAQAKQRLEIGENSESVVDTKEIRTIENVMDQLAVSQFIAKPALSFSEARRSSFLPGLE